MPKSSSLVLATDREVQNAKPNGERAEYRIKGLKNLVLRISPSGAKTWYFLYASPTSGQRRKVKIGTYPSKGLAEVKKNAMSFTVDVLAGNDPLAQRQADQAADPFASLAARYMVEHERKNARAGRRSQSTEEAQRLLDADILPKLGQNRRRGGNKAASDGGSRGRCRPPRLCCRGPGARAHPRNHNWAAATGRLELNPTLGLKKRNTGRPRERVLSEGEIRALSALARHAIEAFPRNPRRAQVAAPPRRAHQRGAGRSEGRSRSRSPHLDHPGSAHQIEARAPIASCSAAAQHPACRQGSHRQQPRLFPSPVDNDPVRSPSASRALLRFRHKIALPDVGTHDLRRTLATGLGDMGVADEVIERVLNHAPRTVASRHYNHARHFEPLRQALEAWAERVRRIVDGLEPASNVFPLRVAGEQ